MLRHARTPDEHSITEVLQDLAVPMPFTMAGLRSRLEHQLGRQVRLAKLPMVAAGVPSGIWVGKAGADYLYYAEQTSPFHQAHIVLCLSAHLLLGDPAAAIFDPRLAPDVSPALVRMILGDVTRSPVSDSQAERFAYLALRPACRSLSRLAMKRALRGLTPLHSALLAAVPQAECSVGKGDRPELTCRLYQVVLEIREATLALRPYRDLMTKAAAVREASAAGLGEPQAAAAAEAAVLADAIRHRRAGTVPQEVLGDKVPPTAPDLASEVAWLSEVARAFHRISRDADQPRNSRWRIPRVIRH